MGSSQLPGENAASHWALQDTHWSWGSLYTVATNDTVRPFILRSTAYASSLGCPENPWGAYISAFWQHCSSISVHLVKEQNLYTAPVQVE